MIEGALQTLAWADEILVIDNESEDRTVEIASQYTPHILTAPPTPHFDALRNLAVEHATGGWLFFLDADERMSPRLGEYLKGMVRERGEEFEALQIAFRHVIFGKWLRHGGLWPGYTRPQLLKKGAFRYNERLHGGVEVFGKTWLLPPDDPEFTILHYSYEHLPHYLAKFNRYTDGEALTLYREGKSHAWQSQLAAFVRDLQQYYDRGRMDQDGMHGFIYSVLGGFYRFAARAKLWDLRRLNGELSEAEPVPGSVREMLQFMLHVSEHGAEPWISLPKAPALPPSRRNAVILQCAREDQTRLLDLTRAHHEAYAKAHGLDYHCRYGYRPADRHPGWDKIALILEFLRSEAYDELVWLDADTLIVDGARLLTDALPPGKWLGMVQHQTPGRPPYFNDGVMYIRRTPEALAFFEAVWDTWPVESAWQDNWAVIHVLEQCPEHREGVVTLGDEWNSTAAVNESPSPVVCAWHGYGSTDRRQAAMLDVLHELRKSGGLKPPALPAPPELSSAGNGSRPTWRQAPPQRLPANPVALDPPADVNFSEVLGRPLRVRWEGDQLFLSSLALVNREFCLGLLQSGDVELSLSAAGPDHTLGERDNPRFGALRERLGAELSGPADVTIRHHFPPNWTRPAEGKLIVIQPWEYGYLPRDWVAGARNADEVWVYSRWVRDVYVRSGVPAEKVRVVPLGFNPETFAPKGRRYPLPTDKALRFLFVGGAIDRKGADLLLEAYRRAFTREDDVCLVVKDMGTRTFYRGATLGEAFRQAQADAAGPEVLYLDEDLSERKLASLYRACSCVVLPYRGEGFALAPLEGMACGLPAIVTAGGPTDDYLDDSLALRVPSRRRPLGERRVGAFPCAEEPWVLEPDLDALVAAFRWVRDHPEETRERGRKARAFVESGWHWARAVGVARENLRALVTPAAARETLTATPWGEGAAVEEPQGASAEAPEPGADTGPRAKKSARKSKAGQAPVRLSLCMIARDEEARIRACLESIRPHVDEMVVVDTGSQDRTREIARECGARVFEFPWCDDFAAARNASLEQARGEWIFWMDADDVISPECGRQLRDLTRRHPQRDTAYQVQVRIPPGPGEFSPAVVDHVKLFPNRPDLRFEYRIHEQILPALRRAGLEVLPSDLYVTHANYDRSTEGQTKKRLRDFRLLELDLRDRPEHPFVLFNLGMTHLYATRDYEVAAQYLRRSLAGSHPADSIVRKAYALLTTARICQEQWEEAAAVNEEGRRHYPDDAELLFQAGQIYQQLGRFDLALAALERLVNGSEDGHYRSVDASLRTYRGRHELALLFRRRGDLGLCELLLDEIRRDEPHYLPAQLDLVETLATAGKTENARAVLEAIPADPALEPEIERLRMLLAASAGVDTTKGSPGSSASEAGIGEADQNTEPTERGAVEGYVGEEDVAPVA